jgi:hypothetical protein
MAEASGELSAGNGSGPHDSAMGQPRTRPCLASFAVAAYEVVDIEHQVYQRPRGPPRLLFWQNQEYNNPAGNNADDLRLRRIVRCPQRL